MLESVKIQKRQSEIRENLAALVGKENPDENETRSMSELDSEYQRNETRYRAALTAESEERREAGEELEKREDKEFSDLLGKFEVRQIAAALDHGHQLDGETAEVVAELRSQGTFQGIPVPWGALEQRAGETVSSGIYEPKQTRPVIDRLFPNSVAARLGVSMVNIAQGELEFPVATAGASVGWQSDELSDVGAAQAYTTGEVSLKPDHTGGAQMVLSRKSLKQSGTGLEQAVRRDMSAAIAAEMDRAILVGSGATGEPLGLISGAATYGITDTDMAAASPDWAAFKAEVVAFMNANAITDPSQVRLGITPAIWSDLDDAIWDAGSGITEWDRMAKHIGAGNITLATQMTAGTSILSTTVNGVAPAYVGLYGAVDMIRDPFTKAGSGQLVLTGLFTMDVAVARSVQTRVLSNFG